MLLKCVKAEHYGLLTVGKFYETHMVEDKNFLTYGSPYFEVKNDDGDLIGIAPCDFWTQFEPTPSTKDAHK